MVNRLLLHLKLIPGIGAGYIERLVRKLSQEQLAALPEVQVSELVAWGIPHALAEKVINGLRDKKLLEVELALLERQPEIRLVSLFDSDYPELARHIHAPAPVLYLQGHLPVDYSRSLAVVGSRIAADYGKTVVDRIVPELVRDNFLIISGGARGIDTFAHQAAVQAGGRTIAVIGSGLLMPYPASNIKLFEKIVHEGGAVISPFPLMMQPLADNFPARNRVIAGMSRGCLVVQAAAKSGALITASYALKEGREVLAVPGSIIDPLSAGCHALLAQGASLAQSADDIRAAFELPSFAQGSGGHGPLISAHGELVESMQRNSESQPSLVRFCASPQPLDLMLAHEGCTQEELYGRLWELQIAGLIKEVSSGMWLANS